jgi:hypothetical protein
MGWAAWGGNQRGGHIQHQENLSQYLFRKQQRAQNYKGQRNGNGREYRGMAHTNYYCAFTCPAHGMPRAEYGPNRIWCSNMALLSQAEWFCAPLAPWHFGPQNELWYRRRRAICGCYSYDTHPNSFLFCRDIYCNCSDLINFLISAFIYLYYPVRQKRASALKPTVQYVFYIKRSIFLLPIRSIYIR